MADTILAPQLAALLAGTAIMTICATGTAILLRTHPATRLAATDPACRRDPPAGAAPTWLALATGSLLVLASSILAVPPPRVGPSVLLGCTLLALAIFDLRALVLPNILTLFLAGSGLAVTALTLPEALPNHLIGVAAGFVALVAVGQAYRLWRGRVGLGMGDAKLLGAAGAWVSWTGLSDVVLIGAASALVYGVLVGVLSGRPLHEERVPFGAFLCLGIWTTWLIAS